MAKIKFELPEGAESVSFEVEGRCIIATYEPKKVFNKNDIVVFEEYGKKNWGIVSGIGKGSCKNNIYISKFVDNKMVKDYMINVSCVYLANNKQIHHICNDLGSKGLYLSFEDKDVKPRRWRAERGIKYFYVTSRGYTDLDFDDRRYCDDTRYIIGNYYQTEEQANKVCPEIVSVFDKHKHDLL